MIQGQEFVNIIKLFQFSHIAFVGCLIVLFRNPFSLCCLYLCLFLFLGKSCNDQQYFPRHACIVINV